MSKSKIEKKMNKLLKLSKHQVSGVHSIAIENNSSFANGLSEIPVKPQIAILFMKEGENITFNGHIHEELVNESKYNEPTIIVTDHRESDNIQIFITADNKNTKIYRYSDFSEDDLFILYWEYGPHSFFTLGFKNLLDNTVVLESIFGKEYSTREYNRYLLGKLLPEKESKNYKELLSKKFKYNGEENEE